MTAPNHASQAWPSPSVKPDELVGHDGAAGVSETSPSKQSDKYSRDTIPDTGIAESDTLILTVCASCVSWSATTCTRIEL